MYLKLHTWLKCIFSLIISSGLQLTVRSVQNYNFHELLYTSNTLVIVKLLSKRYFFCYMFKLLLFNRSIHDYLSHFRCINSNSKTCVTKFDSTATNIISSLFNSCRQLHRRYDDKLGKFNDECFNMIDNCTDVYFVGKMVLSHFNRSLLQLNSTEGRSFMNAFSDQNDWL